MHAIEFVLSSSDEVAASYMAPLRQCSAELGRPQVQGVSRRLRSLLRAPTHGLWGEITLAVRFTTVMTVRSFHSLITWLLARESGGLLPTCRSADCVPTQHLSSDKLLVLDPAISLVDTSNMFTAHGCHCCSTDKC